jgi:Tfp pilus assembly protein FimT
MRRSSQGDVGQRVARPDKGVASRPTRRFPGDAPFTPLSGRATPTRSRAGYTLVQLLVVIATATVLLTTGAMILATMLRSQAVAHEHLRQTRLRSRLTRVFLDDVHAAQSADTQNEALALSEGERKVSYRMQGTRLIRQETAAGNPVSQEAFTLNDLAVRFEISPEGEAELVKLVLSSSRNGEFTVQARLGRDLRFVAAGGAP